MAKRSANTAVLARRAAKEDNEGLSEEDRLWKKLDFFATPPWAARAGLEHAAKLWGSGRHMLEPAAGRGHIARPAEEYFGRVEGSDIYDHGKGYYLCDWLDEAAWPDHPVCDVVFTNPPFQHAEEFVMLGLKRARLGVGLLLRLGVLEGGERFLILGGEKARLTQAVVFSERVPMTLGDWDPEATTATAYAWFYWSKVHDPMPIDWFPPGTRSRLSRRTDPMEFGKLKPLPLFPRSEDPGDVV